eukprot:TRINITY_DN4339_c1_g1_i1.p1 TRINITY_DN4339_c1_g1~~TRINITY_DN4339_c1_g1_i1.p1  ORF type:complete len:931 (-),score=243.42 TRINITY_DN4339_c1_g1_i1:545-3337(-)
MNIEHTGSSLLFSSPTNESVYLATKQHFYESQSDKKMMSPSTTFSTVPTSPSSNHLSPLSKSHQARIRHQEMNHSSLLTTSTPVPSSHHNNDCLKRSQSVSPCGVKRRFDYTYDSHHDIPNTPSAKRGRISAPPFSLTVSPPPGSKEILSEGTQSTKSSVGRMVDDQQSCGKPQEGLSPHKDEKGKELLSDEMANTPTTLTAPLSPSSSLLPSNTASNIQNQSIIFDSNNSSWTFKTSPSNVSHHQHQQQQQPNQSYSLLYTTDLNNGSLLLNPNMTNYYTDLNHSTNMSKHTGHSSTSSTSVVQRNTSLFDSIPESTQSQYDPNTMNTVSPPVSIQNAKKEQPSRARRKLDFTSNRSANSESTSTNQILRQSSREGLNRLPSLSENSPSQNVNPLEHYYNSNLGGNVLDNRKTFSITSKVIDPDESSDHSTSSTTSSSSSLWNSTSSLRDSGSSDSTDVPPSIPPTTFSIRSRLSRDSNSSNSVFKSVRQSDSEREFINQQHHHHHHDMRSSIGLRLSGRNSMNMRNSSTSTSSSSTHSPHIPTEVSSQLADSILVEAGVDATIISSPRSNIEHQNLRHSESYGTHLDYNDENTNDEFVYVDQFEEARRDRHQSLSIKLSTGLLDTYKRITSVFNKLVTEKEKKTSKKANFYKFEEGEILGGKYRIIELIGKGSFGQVVKAEYINSSPSPSTTQTYVAIKIIRRSTPFLNQGRREVQILNSIKESPGKGTSFMVQFIEDFVHNEHLCLVFELLSHSLLDLVNLTVHANNQQPGLSLRMVHKFAHQLLCVLSTLSSINIIHCDLKPENVALASPNKAHIKVIDFGSSCHSWENLCNLYPYIQSRFYRAPEILLGCKYGFPIDMWSVGCIIVELYTARPLFTGRDSVEQLYAIMDVLGPPPSSMLEQAAYLRRFFKLSNGNLYPKKVTTTN